MLERKEKELEAEGGLSTCSRAAVNDGVPKKEEEIEGQVSVGSKEVGGIKNSVKRRK